MAEDGRSNGEPATAIEPDGGSAPIDFELLERIGRRLDRSARFRSMELRPEYAPDSLIVDYDCGYFPATVERAYLRIRWFENDDFNVHYAEQYESSGGWECRWDRHPSAHNTRDHFHPPPDAETPGENRSYPTDWRDVVATVLRELDTHVKELWE